MRKGCKTSVLQIAWLMLLASGASPVCAAESLVGTWKLLRFENFTDQGAVRPFGEKPAGYFVYTADGRVSIQIQHEKAPEQWRSLETSAHEGSSNTPWYVGYFGRYTLDQDAGTVTHHVEGGTILHYRGTDQVRPFELDGDRLVIGKKGEWERELRRVR